MEIHVAWLSLLHSAFACAVHSSAAIDELALHPLSSRISAGKRNRHAVIQRTRNATNFLFQPEPLGLDKGDSRPPGGITVFLLGADRSLIWDAVCCDTWSQTCIILSAVPPGSCSIILGCHRPVTASVSSFWKFWSAWSLIHEVSCVCRFKDNEKQ